jgi:hypothetical protein
MDVEVTIGVELLKKIQNPISILISQTLSSVMKSEIQTKL